MRVRHDRAVGGKNEARTRAALFGNFALTREEGEREAETAEDFRVSFVHAGNARRLHDAGVADDLNVDDGWTVFLHEFDEVGQRRLLFILSEQGRFGRGGRKGRRGERGAQGRGKGRGFQSKRHIASFSQWKDGWRRGCWS